MLVQFGTAKGYNGAALVTQGLIRLWRSEGLAAFDRVKDRDIVGNPPLIETRNWILPGPPTAIRGGRWQFWVEINGKEPDLVPAPRFITGV
jgi:hypothetical protein